MYDAEEIRTSANKILKMSGDISEDMNAPSMVPGTATNPSFQPSESSIRFCLAYIAVDATELLNTANRLLLTASVERKSHECQYWYNNYSTTQTYY